MFLGLVSDMGSDLKAGLTRGRSRENRSAGDTAAAAAARKLTARKRIAGEVLMSKWGATLAATVMMDRRCSMPFSVTLARKARVSTITASSGSDSACIQVAFEHVAVSLGSV